MNRFSKLSALLLLLLLCGDMHAQLRNYEFGFCIRKKNCVPETSGWRLKHTIFGITMRAHTTIVDFIIDEDADNKFRFGDYLGAAFSTGFVKETVDPDNAEPRQLGTMWISIDLRAGLQAAYRINVNLAVGAYAYFEYQFDSDSESRLSVPASCLGGAC